VTEKGKVTLTREGVPQGGVISPVLMNVALHGMEQAAGVRYWEGGGMPRAVPGTPGLVRYADDLAVLCVSRAQAEQVRGRLACPARSPSPCSAPLRRLCPLLRLRPVLPRHRALRKRRPAHRQPCRHPQEALDTACTLYLAGTGDEPTSGPPTDLRA